MLKKTVVLALVVLMPIVAGTSLSATGSAEIRR